MIEDVPELSLRDENQRGEGEATSTSGEDDGGKSGGNVGAEREEDGGAIAKVSKLNLIRSLFVCLIVCLFVDTAATVMTLWCRAE